MRREDVRIPLAARLEKNRREPVAERAVSLGEHRVRALAQERVAKGVLVLAGEPSLAARLHDLALDERLERAAELVLGRRLVLADEREHAPHAERSRRRRSPRGGRAAAGLERAEPRLDHAEHRLGQASPRPSATARTSSSR